MSQHEDGEIRKKVAENKNTPVSILKKLVPDKNERVRKAAAQNLNITLH